MESNSSRGRSMIAPTSLQSSFLLRLNERSSQTRRDRRPRKPPKLVPRFGEPLSSTVRSYQISLASFDRCGAAREEGKPSPEGEGVRRSLTDEALRSNIAINPCLTLFSLTQKAQRKKLCKKEMPLLRALPEPASFLKKARPKIIRAIIDRPREAERLPYRQIILYLRRGGACSSRCSYQISQSILDRRFFL